MMEWLGYVAAGVVAGFIAGLFGVGGGLVIVPALLLVFSWQGMSADIAMHVAVGTSLMTICVTSLSSMYAHHRYATVDWRVVKRLAPVLAAGALGGAFIAGSLSSIWMQKLFALFALVMAVRLWLPQPSRWSGDLLRGPALYGFGVSAGLLSALIGIGGGTLVVPYLLMAGLQVKRAVGSAAACGFPIALAGGLGFMLFGAHFHAIDARWQTGFVHWQAFAGVISASIVFAPVGARLARQLPADRLRHAFSLFLVLVAVVFVLR